MQLSGQHSNAEDDEAQSVQVLEVTEENDDEREGRNEELQANILDTESTETRNIDDPEEKRLQLVSPGQQGARATNENPNFVRDYFAQSRLHFIGSFRARYESLMCSVAGKLGVPVAQLLRSAPPPPAGRSRIVVHVDIDCFFASIAIAANPDLRGKPIAVCHARSNGAGSGEISSCSYEARAFGVKAGMFFHSAKELCANLIAVPYDFASYERASVAMYARFYSVQNAYVEAMSVDEAFIDLTHSTNTNIDQLIRTLRDDIFTDTGCTTSAGIGPNKLCARVATSQAKPNGQRHVNESQVMHFLRDLPLRELPGIGRRTRQKMEEWKVSTCGELAAVPLVTLQREFGDKQGKTFHDAARGHDTRPVEAMKPRKSIGAEVSWGVRFTASDKDAGKSRKFVTDLASEVAERVLSAGAIGSKVLYKVYRSKNIAGKMKYLGHGPCNVLTKSMRIQGRVDKENLQVLLASTCWRIHKEIGIPDELLRGVGIQVTDLVFEHWHQAGDQSGIEREGRIDGFLKRKGSSLFDKTSLAPVIPQSSKKARPNFFTPKKKASSTNAWKTDTMECPADWDRSVFEALPEDVRNELLTARKRETGAGSSGRADRQGTIKFGKKVQTTMTQFARQGENGDTSRRECSRTSEAANDDSKG